MHDHQPVPVAYAMLVHNNCCPTCTLRPTACNSAGRFGSSAAPEVQPASRGAVRCWSRMHVSDAAGRAPLQLGPSVPPLVALTADGGAEAQLSYEYGGTGGDASGGAVPIYVAIGDVCHHTHTPPAPAPTLLAPPAPLSGSARPPRRSPGSASSLARFWPRAEMQY